MAAGVGLLGAKLVAMLGLWLGSFSLGVLPQLLRVSAALQPAAAVPGGLTLWARHQALAVSLLLCFGGGVLLFTTFVHLQPEVREGFAALRRAGQLPEQTPGLPLAELVFCAGFFFVYLVEELVHLLLDSRHRQRHRPRLDAASSAQDSDAAADFVGAEDDEEEAEEEVLHRTMSLRRCSRRGGGDGHGTVPPTPAPTAKEPPSPLQLQLPPPPHAATAGSGSGSNVSTQGLLRTESAIGMVEKQSSPLDAEVRMSGAFPFGPAAVASAGGAGGRVPTLGVQGPPPATPGPRRAASSCSLRSLLAVVALSFHAVFEGLAVGLEQQVGNVWYLLVAVATHKLVITFCVGVELVSARTRTALVLVYMGVFAAVTPAGVGLGLALSATPATSAAAAPGLVPVVLQAMAAGTLLYVVFFEVLQRERAPDRSGIMQLTAIATGFALMLALQYATGHDHEHHHGGGDHSHDLQHDHDHDQVHAAGVAAVTDAILQTVVANVSGHK